MEKVIIYLTNLTHVNNGIAAMQTIPLNIGFLASYAKQVFKDRVEIELFNMPSDLMDAVKRRSPHILAGSNYCWNSNLSYHYLAYLKKQSGNLVTVMGGPNFSYNAGRRKDFLKKKPFLDFYITGEGEIAFANLVQQCLNSDLDIDRVKEDGKEMLGCHYLLNGELVSNSEPARTVNLDDFPSPYLTGCLDKFLDAGLTPIMQTSRGCPFTCAYCCSSVSYHNKVNFFSIDRVEKEIEYVAQKSKSHMVHLHDDNFGMFERDYLISKKFKEANQRYGWPVFLHAATGKNNQERIIKCAELLGSVLPFTTSVQSTSQDVLVNIDRQNINIGDLMAIQDRLKHSGLTSATEIIVPLPGETLQSHLEGLRLLINAGVDPVCPYTTMLLPGSPLYEDRRFDKFEMIKKFRVIPRDFGRYEGANVVEVEEVCVGTKDMSFEEYVFAREFHLIINCYYNGEAFKELFNFLRSAKCDMYKYCYALLTNINTAPEQVRKIFEEFSSDTKKELWNSEDQINSYYAEDDNFSKLMRLEEGANLLQKNHARFLSGAYGSFLEYAINVAERLFGDAELKGKSDIIDSIRTYLLCSRNNIFAIMDKDIVAELEYDIHAWKEAGYAQKLSEYKKAVTLRFLQTDTQVKTIRKYLEIFGDTEDGKGKILTRISPKVLLREAEKI